MLSGEDTPQTEDILRCLLEMEGHDTHWQVQNWFLLQRFPWKVVQHSAKAGVLFFISCVC